MPLSPASRLGSYEILAAIGAGGMGEVYRARDSKLNRDVALKVLPDVFARDPERMARFQREAQVLASLNHPNIAAIYGLEESGSAPALVMELVEGPTLADRIAGGPLSLEEALPAARQIAEALEAAHEKGIIHRDLKPANVKVTPDGKVKVLDFGLAKALDDEAGAADPRYSPTLSIAATRAGVILGTAAYMSPEQAKGKPVDRRADIWAFGVVLLEMLTGRQTYSGETAAETLASVMKDEPPVGAVPADTPNAIHKLLRRCLEKDSRRRLRDIGEARIVIEDVLSGGAEERAPARAAPVPVVTRGLRRIVPWLMAGLLLVTTLLFALLYLRQGPAPERVLRYTLAPPEKSSVQTFALSPDGRSLAMTAVTEGKRRLWMRGLDALEAQALPGTDEAFYPFWSPDSRYIGFFAQGKLRKIAASGGPAQTLCDAPDGRGGSWNREGVIVFAPTANGALQRVAAAGGVPAAVTKVEGGGNNRFPVFLPDGRRFLYFVHLTKEQDGIYVGSLDSTQGGRLLTETSSTVYVQPASGSRQGHLLFLRENTLVAQPVDPKTLQPAGDLFPVAEGVPFGLHNNFAPISVSSEGTLVYPTGRGALEGQLAWFDRSGKQLGPMGAPGRILGFELSPDEKKVALSRAEDRTGDVWLHELDRGTETRLTFHVSRNIAPIWSPDGSRIVFSSDRGGQFDLFQKPSSGAGQDEPLLEDPWVDAAWQISPDGRMLVYGVLDPRTRWDLWALPLQGDRKPVPFLVTEFMETQGQVSPDGKWMVYTSNESGRPEVYVQAYPKGSGPEGKWKVSLAGGQSPRWRRDGKELFYLDPGGRLVAVPVKPAKPGSGFEVGAQEALFESRLAFAPLPLGWPYVVTADGKRFLLHTNREQATAPPLVVVVNWQAGVKK